MLQDVTALIPLPSFLVPAPYTKGGRPDPPAISKTVAFMNMKFCRVLETSLNVLEMLSCLHSVYLVIIVAPQRRCVLTEKSLDFSRKYQYLN